MSDFERAVEFAARAHEGMTRKGSDIPYITHPLEAAQIVQTMTDDEAVWIAAVLHDTVEDTPVTIDDIRREFGERVAELVGADTEDKREHLPAADTWKIRKQETVEHLKSSSDTAGKMVVLADKLSNIRQLAVDYENLGEKVWERFNQKDKNEHKWYYESVLEAARELAGYAAWQECAGLVKKVFGS